MSNFSRQIDPCSQADSCRNSLTNASPALQKCSICRLAPGNEDFSAQFWSSNDRTKHVQLEWEKKEISKIVKADRVFIRKNKSKPRQKLLKKAVKAEKSTERNIISSTENSGRAFRDGDHVLQGFITLDTKMQSNRTHPVVKMEELDKVRQDAKRGGNQIGGLVLRNKHNIGVVVMREEDYAVLVASLGKKDGTEN